MTRFANRLSLALAFVAMMQILILMTIMVYEVICRFGFNSPNIWSYDLAYMLTGTLFLLGAAYTLREQAHVRIDFISQNLPERFRQVIEAVFLLVLFLPILGFMTWSVAGKAADAWTSGQTDYTSPWSPVMWPFYSGIAIGLAALWVQALARALECFHRYAGNADRASA